MISDLRVGCGYDSHRFEAGRRLVLGGVVFPDEMGLKGHSDADVLIHAVIDAVLGAAGRGDIGSHFPDTDPKWKDADSSKLLEAVMGEVAAAGWRIGNLDVTLICERPKIRPQVEAIRAHLATLLHVEPTRISVKGKTNEKMDDIGAGVGIAALATCLLIS